MTDPTQYKLNHSMLRVKDPKASLQFYQHLGMSLVNKSEFPDNKFDLYFLAYDSPRAISHGSHRTDREGVVELTHNYGTESDPNYTVCNGNDDHGKGFGHIAISVDNIQAACKRLSDAGYKFQKRLEDGPVHHIAFVLDPDGYWVEILAQNPVSQTAEVRETDPAVYRMNHTMIRVKDKDESIRFYEDMMGMSVMGITEMKAFQHDFVFMGYGDKPTPRDASDGVSATSQREGLLELAWNYGTEKLEGKVYHDGNSEPQGFGHVCITVDDLDEACKRFDQKGITWKKRLTEGRMRHVAFVLDPNGYWIEVLQNESYKKAT